MESFNAGKGHKVDDLFKDVFSNYKEEPSSGLWDKLNNKIINNPAQPNPTHNPGFNNFDITSFLTNQWTIISSAFITVAVVTTTIIYNVNNNNEPSSSESDKIAQNIDKTAEILTSNTQSADIKDFNTAHNFRQNVNTNINPNNYSDTKENNINKQNKKNTNSSVPNNYNNNNNFPANQDINNPKSGIFNDKTQNNTDKSHSELKDSSRVKDAMAVDSLIQALIAKDSLMLIAKSRIPKENIFIDSTSDIRISDDVITLIENSGDKPVIIPNVFTPNGDGLNDYFYIANLEYYPENTLLIQDRKGRIIYRQNRYLSNWNGSNAPDGSYLYILTYLNKEKIRITQKGIVYIIRDL